MARYVDGSVSVVGNVGTRQCLKSKGVGNAESVASRIEKGGEAALSRLLFTFRQRDLNGALCPDNVHLVAV